MSAEHNYSLFTIPAYLVLAMTPHMYSVALLRRRSSGELDSKKSDNVTSSDSAEKTASFPKSRGSLYNVTNPRSPANSSYYASQLPGRIYQRYERARAAHNNMLENAPFVVAAVVSAVVAKLDASYANKMCATYLLTRVLYTFSYIGVESLRWSSLRTLWYLAGNVVLLDMFWKAGWTIAK